MNAEPRTSLGQGLLIFGIRSALGLSAAACLTLSSAPAGAQSGSESATAQALFDSAKKLIKAGKYAEACPALEESQRIEARSGTALNLADCYEHVGRLASAWSTFVEAATLAKATGNVARERGARERATALASRLSNLVINAPAADSTPDLQISRDGERVGSAQLGLPLPTDPGEHTIAASAPGRKPWHTTVMVEGEASTANVVVPDLPSDAPAPAATNDSGQAAHAPTTPAPADDTAASQGNSGVIAAGVVTGVFAVGTVITSILYSSKLHDYNTANDRGAANSSSLRSSAHTLGVVNLALLGGAVASAAVTVVLWATAPSQAAPASARLQLRGTVGPGMAGLSLRGAL